MRLLLVLLMNQLSKIIYCISKCCVDVRYSTSVACWSYCNPVKETGNKSLNLTSTCGLFLLDNTLV